MGPEGLALTDVGGRTTVPESLLVGKELIGDEGVSEGVLRGGKSLVTDGVLRGGKSLVTGGVLTGGKSLVILGRLLGVDIGV